MYTECVRVASVSWSVARQALSSRPLVIVRSRVSTCPVRFLIHVHTTVFGVAPSRGRRASIMTFAPYAYAFLCVYSLLLTIVHFGTTPKLNFVCARDHVDPATEGSCLCGEGHYCLCTPSLASDILIEVEPEGSDPGGIVFIVRGDGRGLAMVGGFVRVGESAEDAARREALEETGLHVDKVRQFCMFSDPKRDPRRQTSAMVFVAKARGRPRAMDDAKGVRVIPLDGARQAADALRRLLKSRPFLTRQPAPAPERDTNSSAHRSGRITPAAVASPPARAAELKSHMPKFAFDHARIVEAYLARYHLPAGLASAAGAIGEACPAPGSYADLLPGAENDTAGRRHAKRGGRRERLA